MVPRNNSNLFDYYTVSKGDTLYKIAQDNNIDADLLAQLNKSVYDIMDEYELTERSRDRAEREFQKKGDEIICKGKVYEVLAPNDEPVWRWSGLNEETMRIHTKEIGDDVNAFVNFIPFFN